MENSKDCHNCAFDLMCRNIGDWVGIRTPCSAYKDRSRFVELPCKVGDRLYVLISKSKYIAEYVVIAFWIEESGTIIRIVDTRFFTTSILFTKDIGTKAFLTKEEAEQALKERNKDGEL